MRWHFHGGVLDELSLQLSVAGQVVAIERKPLEVLRYLLRHAGEVVTKDELLEAVWPGRILSDSVLAKAISRLRDVLGDGTEDRIKTIKGYGYRWVAEVRVEHLAAALPKPLVLGLKQGDHPRLRPNWVLAAHLESGGHGEVWRVQHERNPEQRVFKFALDEAALSSLKREITLNRLLRQSLGERAAITPVLDWNLQEAPFFIELPHRPLGSLLDWASAAGGLAQQPHRVRLELAAQIADATATAHGIGVLHKDLKPANVLVTGSAAAPLIELTDFGSGAVLEQGQLEALGITRMGLTQSLSASDSSGTAIYLAPEVLAGQPPSLRSDLYALGVLLYQLIAGDFKKPLSPGWERDIDDPLLQADIAAAADGNPEHRLADAAELARRLRGLDARRAAQRVQAEQARGLAAAHAAAEENRQLRARRRWQWALMSAMACGLMAALWLYQRAELARAAATEAAKTADAVSHFLNEDVLANIDPDQSDLRTLTVQQLLEKAAQQVDGRFADQPLAAARTKLSLANAFMYLGRMELAEAQLYSVWDAGRALLKSAPDAAIAVARLAMVSPETMRAEYLDYWQQVADLASQRLGQKHPDSLQLRGFIAAGHGWLMNLEPAVAGLQSVLDDLETLDAPDPNLLAQTLNALSLAYRDLGRFKAAEAVLLKAVALAVQDEGSQSQAVAELKTRLGSLYAEMGQLAAADAAYTDALKLHSARLGDNSPNLALVRQKMIRLRTDQGRLAEAEQLAREGLRARQASDGATSLQVSYAQIDLAKVLVKRGQLEAALALATSGANNFATMAAAPGGDSRQALLSLANSQLLQADILRRLHRLAEARAGFDAVKPEVLKASWVIALDQLSYLRTKGNLLAAEGKPLEAKLPLAEALKIATDFYGADHPTTQLIRSEAAPLP